MSGGSTNGQGSGPGTGGPTPPDASEVVEHIKAAGEELAAAGKAFLDMLDQAVGGLLNAMTGWADPQRRAKAERPKVERIDVEDEREPPTGG